MALKYFSLNPCMQSGVSECDSCTCVVAVDVVLLLDPHICWNCTLISANVSMITAMNTFWGGENNRLSAVRSHFCGWIMFHSSAGEHSANKKRWKVRRDRSPYLNKPCQKENKGDKVEVWAPARETVNGSVHEKHPALLRCSLIHSEDTRA